MSKRFCPYCIREIVVESDDHIFSDFLGGKKTIIACIVCNNRFGHEFEGKAAVETLHRLYISIASWGLPLKKNIPTWRRAFQHRGVNFDLSLHKGVIQPQLSKPIVQKNSSGRVVAVAYRGKKEAEKALGDLQKKGKAPHGTIEKIQFEISPHQVPIDFKIDNNLMRLAVKMCMALATELPEFDLVEILLGRLVLDGANSPHTIGTIAFEDYVSLNGLRKPLSHVVYVERFNSRVIGVVQFFGVVQLHCVLGRSDEKTSDAALIGTLDPITNKESFGSVKPALGLVDPVNPLLDNSAYVIGTDRWLRNFEKAAIDRGATNKVSLAGTLEIGKEREV